MLDIDLLKSFVSVVDAGGFTRAGERVHRTQSTVSQQIRRLEDSLGRPLLHRDGKGVTLTDEGERLLSYARRIIALAAEARDAVARPPEYGVIRIGLPEDFAAYRLTQLLSDFVRSHPGLRLNVSCDLSLNLRADLERGELDLALAKSERGQGRGMGAWPERLFWVTSKTRPVDIEHQPVPLAVYPQGCLYRLQAVHGLESARRSWYVAYTSHNLTGVQAAISAGLGIGILPEVAVLPDHKVLGVADGFPALESTELALLAAPDAKPITLSLGKLLADFCNAFSVPTLCAAE